MVYCSGALAETDYDAAGQGTAGRNPTPARAGVSIFTHTHDDAGARAGGAGSGRDRGVWSHLRYVFPQAQVTGVIRGQWCR
jgi:hypothetical protein